MTAGGIDAAWADDPRDRRTVERFHEVPYGYIELGCPNCSDPAHLVIIEKAIIHRQLFTAVKAVGTNTVETVDSAGPDEAVIAVGPDPEFVGVRCETCRWSLESPTALNHLRPL